MRENVPAAAAWMIGGQVFFVGLAVCVKLASSEATAMQAMFFRSVFSALPLLAVMAVRRIPLRGPRPGLLLLRGFVGFLGLFFYVWAVSHAPIADVLALQQLSPIFVAFLSVILLHERPRRVHVLLAIVCLLGAFLILRPTRGLLSLDAAGALVSAFLSSVAYVAVRALTRTEPTERIVFWFACVAGMLCLPFVLLDWHPLSLRASLFLTAGGFMAVLAQTMMTASYRRAPAHIASAFTYVSVPFAYLAGILLWHERPDALANVGIALIVAAGIAFVSVARSRVH